MRFYSGHTADEVWTKAFNDTDTWQLQGSRNGDTLEAYRAMFEINNPRERWVLSRIPKLNVAFAIAEVIWILNGDDSLDFLTAWNSKYSEFVGELASVHGAYGYRLRATHGIDQLTAAATALRHNPDSRQVVLEIYSPVKDLPGPMGEPRSSDIPCNIVSLLKIRDGKLQWTQILRSNDLILGTPYNFVQFTCLQEVLAGWIGVDLGSYAHYSDSLHLYSHHRAAFEEGDLPKNVDDMRLPIEESSVVLPRVFDLCRSLGRASSEDEITNLLHAWQLPPAYANMVTVLASERARRLKLGRLERELLATCSNGALRRAQEMWSAGPRRMLRTS